MFQVLPETYKIDDKWYVRFWSVDDSYNRDKVVVAVKGSGHDNKIEAQKYAFYHTIHLNLYPVLTIDHTLEDF